MKTKLLIIALSFLSLNSYAQIKFEAGYFINNTGERIDCLIRNVDWKNNPTRFVYKLSEDSEAITVTIEAVQEFGVADYLKYERVVTGIDRTSALPKDLEENREPKLKEETLFLKLLVEGAANLYKYEDGNLRRFFFKYEASEVEQLIYLKYKTSIGQIKENHFFKSQLWSHLKCQKVSSVDIEKLDYKENDFIKYFLKYNACKDEKFKEYKRTRVNGLIHLSVKPRANFYAFSIDHFYENRNTNMNYEVSPGIGLELEFVLPFNKNKWSMFIEPSYQNHTSEKNNGSYLVNLNYETIEFAMGIRHYFFMGNNSRMFLNGGMTVSQEINSLLQFEYQPGSPGPAIFIDDLEIEASQTYWLGVGYDHNDKLNIELRYKTASNLLNRYDNNWTSKFNGFAIVLGYKIF